MPSAVTLRTDFSASELRRQAKRSKEHVRQPLRDEPVDKASAAWGEPILGGPKKSPLEANETLSSYSSRFSAHLRLYGFVIGIVSGDDVDHGFPVLGLQLILLSSIMRSRRLIAFHHATLPSRSPQ